MTILTLVPGVCPYCGEDFDPKNGECGGEGMGNCAGILAALSDDPAAEWPELMDHAGDTDPYPGDDVMRAYRAHYDAFAASLDKDDEEEGG